MSKKKPLNKEDSLNIIAIGASAGGLEALQSFLSNLPQLPNSAIIIAQHLSPTHKSLLVELLSKYTSMKVDEANHGTTIAKRTIYITPPDKEIQLINGKISLKKPTALIGPKPSVDILFQSMVNLKKELVVAVILSGTGSDGAKGLASLNGKNILKIAQAPKSSKYDGMPNAAIQLGDVDLILTPEDMGDEISLFLNKQESSNRIAQVNELKEKTHFERVLFLVGNHTGIDFTNYKKATLERRLDKRMQMLKIEDIDDYVNILKGNTQEIDILFNMMLIGVTHFFRDSKSFSALNESLVKILSKKPKNEAIRIWVPGCSTGEEAYSIAILVNEILEKTNPKYQLQIFATDVDAKAISFARKGIYSAKNVEGMPDEIRDKYFSRKGNFFELNKEIRSRILFSVHDLIKNPPFLRLDLISCRNLLIYFNAKLQQQVLPIFHYALRNDAILFLGRSETIGQFTNLFGTIDQKNKIFIRKTSKRLNVPKFSSFIPMKNRTEPNLINTPYVKKDNNVSDRIKNTIYSSFEHPYVIINNEFDIQEVYGDVRLFLTLNEGSIQVNLIKMVNPEIQIELRGLLIKVLKDNHAQRSEIKKFDLYGNEYYVRIIAKPLISVENSQDLFIVIFEKLDIEEYISRGSTDNDQQIIDHRIQELEIELSTTKQHLQTYIEEMETSNEELQSLNEELQSTNEELQSTNEELETTNEELQSTNEEIQIAYSELKDIHDELAQKDSRLKDSEANSRALLNNNLQAFLLIDNTYQILDFNKKAEQLYANISGIVLERNKSIIDYLPTSIVNYYLDAFKNLFDQRSVSLSFELEVPTKKTDQIWLLNNFTPIKEANGSAKRISVSQLDISEIKKAEIERNAANIKLQGLLSTQTFYVLRTDLEGLHTYWNEIFERDYGWVYPNGIANTSGLDSICPHHHEKTQITVVKCLENPNTPVQVELDKPGKNGEIRTTLWDFVCLTDDQGNPTEIQCSGIEITRLKQLRLNEKRLKNAQKLAKTGSWGYDLKNKTFSYSEELLNILGMDSSRNNYTYEDFNNLFTKDVKKKLKKNREECILQENNKNTLFKFTDKDNNEITLEEWCQIEKDENGEVILLSGTIQDITDKLETQEKLLNSDRIFDYSQDMLCIAGHDGYFKVLNPVWSKTLGWSIDELKAKPYMEFVHPEDKIETSAEAENLQDGLHVYDFENRYLCKDGSYKWLSWKCFSYLAEQKIYAVASDITDIKKDIKLKEEMIEVQKEQNERLLNFAHIVSHNLRSHTSNMLGIFDVLEMEESQILENEYIGMFQTSVHNLNETLTHLNEILDISREIDTKYESVNIEEIIDNCMGSLSQLAIDSQVEISKHIKTTNTIVSTVPAYIESIIFNMITNAIKFKATDRESFLKIYCLEQENHMCLRFEDNGLGIDLDMHGSRLFGLYKTFHNNKDSKGLGLFITKNQVESMKGSISVKSTPDVGTTFSILLPINTGKN